jgi:hypothetical protein
MLRKRLVMKKSKIDTIEEQLQRIEERLANAEAYPY